MSKKEFTLPEGITLTEQEQAIVDALIAFVNDEIAKLQPSGDEGMTEEQVEEAMSKALKAHKIDIEADPKFKEIKNALVEQGKSITAMKESQKGAKAPMSLGQHFKQFMLDNPEKYDALKGKELKSIRLKTAGTILNSTNVSGTIPQAERIPGLNDVAQEWMFIMDVIGSVPTSKPTIEYMEKLNQDGTVAFKLDTESFAQIDFDMEVNSSSAKDTGAFITVRESMLDDIDYLAAEIDRELVYQIKKNADSEILTGTGLTSHLKGIATYATAGFSLTNIEIATPNTWDAISAAMNQVRQTGFDEPDMIFMHPADYENALGSKDSEGRYVGHPSLSPDGTRFAGIPISTTTFITAGYLLVGVKAKSHIAILQDIELAMGYNADGDFAKSYISIRGIMRLHHFIKDNDVYSFVYDQYADIKDAITKV